MDDRARRIDYSALDHPVVLSVLFHPRSEPPGGAPAGSEELMIEVEPGIGVGGRFHPASVSGPTVLFFHGNGEIAADYDELAPAVTGLGINFLPVDYRGYGRSGGRPTVTAMMRDAHRIFEYCRWWLSENGYEGPVGVMGRSLGSASAVELAASYPDRVAGLAVESGFADAGPLLALMGLEPAALGIEADYWTNRTKIAAYRGPTLIIHAEFDRIIPYEDGRALYQASGAADKTLLKIPDAGHNDVMVRGWSDYMRSLSEWGRKLGGRNKESQV
jgi:hypothetical protein